MRAEYLEGSGPMRVLHSVITIQLPPLGQPDPTRLDKNSWRDQTGDCWPDDHTSCHPPPPPGLVLVVLVTLQNFYDFYFLLTNTAHYLSLEISSCIVSCLRSVRNFSVLGLSWLTREVFVEDCPEWIILIPPPVLSIYARSSLCSSVLCILCTTVW